MGFLRALGFSLLLHLPVFILITGFSGRSEGSVTRLHPAIQVDIILGETDNGQSATLDRTLNRVPRSEDKESSSEIVDPSGSPQGENLPPNAEAFLADPPERESATPTIRTDNPPSEERQRTELNPSMQSAPSNGDPERESLETLAAESKASTGLAAGRSSHLDSLVLPQIIGGKESPEYPAAAKSRGIQGDVVFTITIGVRGRINNLELRSSDSPILTRAARRYLESLIFDMQSREEDYLGDFSVSFRL